MTTNKPLRLAVVGDPIDHSLSPVMHQAALDELGIVGSYQALRLDRDQFREFFSREVETGRWDGINITMPHKRLAAELSPHTTPQADKAQSVNTWYWTDSGQLSGTSTDIAAVSQLVSTHLPPDLPVLVLGAGGAAAATVVALEASHQVYISSRRPEAPPELIQRLGLEATVWEWNQPFPQAIVINTTPLGMKSEVLPSRFLDQAAGLFDMAYGSSPTPAISTATQLGIPTVDGIKMLATQAEMSFVLWSNRKPPPGLMERAARSEISPECE